ncbi:hypothetical protein VTK73DRAFT_2331 [Phialemonium thermophilum]|uniref:Uncharacterized protein n=1 Tax=Phialemonium thermophilum TaxID=223376 RepID=A0ABR3VS99_9PEZI
MRRTIPKIRGKGLYPFAAFSSAGMSTINGWKHDIDTSRKASTATAAKAPCAIGVAVRWCQSEGLLLPSTWASNSASSFQVIPLEGGPTRARASRAQPLVLASRRHKQAESKAASRGEPENAQDECNPLSQGIQDASAQQLLAPRLPLERFAGTKFAQTTAYLESSLLLGHITMGMAGGWSCIVRFALHIPLGIVGISGSNLSGAISPLKATGIYDVVPHGRSFLYGVRMYSNWVSDRLTQRDDGKGGTVQFSSSDGWQGVFAFAWNFVMFLGCFGCDGWLLVLLGLVDSLIAGSLLASVVLQGGFIPRTYGACHGATSWRDGADGRNYFATANATVFQHYGQPPAFCRVLVQTWAVAISCG